MSQKSTPKTTMVRLHARDIKPPTPEELQRRRLRAAQEPDLTDPDNPELDSEWFRRAGERRLKRLAELEAVPKERISICLDRDVLEAFRFDGPGYQTRINMALRRVLQDHHLLHRSTAASARKAGKPAALAALNRAAEEIDKARDVLTRRAG